MSSTRHNRRRVIIATITISDTFVVAVADDRIDTFMTAVEEFFRDNTGRGFWVVAPVDNHAHATWLTAASKIELDFDDVSDTHANPDDALVRNMKRLFADGTYLIPPD